MEGGESVVLVGKKPSMAYVMAAMTQFNAGAKEVHVKARGKSISKCVDVAEIIRRKFLPSIRYRAINLGTEEVTTERNQRIGVSTLHIILGIE
jgi:DNA-binding protein Alba